MNKTADEKRPIFVLAAFLFCAIFGLLVGYFGLQRYNESLTWFSAGLFATGILVVFVGLIYPFKWSEFWFSYGLERLGRIGWMRRFEISQHAEGAINLALLINAWSAYVQIIVGAGSYVFNNLATIPFSIFATSWLFFSAHLLFHRLKNLVDLVRIIGADQKSDFKERIEKVTRWFNKASIGFLASGAIVFNVVTIFWIDWQDKVLDRLIFYVTTPWTIMPTFAMAYPPTTITHYTGKFVGGLTYGFLAVIGGLVLMTTFFLSRLASDKTKPTINIYDSDCIKPAEELLNSFWLLTGAGLLLVPFTTALSFSFSAIDLPAASRWMNYISWTYVIFFVGFFFFSLIKFSSFVSTAKKPIEKQIREEFREALEPKVDREKLVAARTKMRLLREFRGRPTVTTILQLSEIIAVVLLNVIISLAR